MTTPESVPATSPEPLIPAPSRRRRSAEDALAGGGEMGALIRSIDWSTTPLGPATSWPQSLKTALSICLSSRFPILIWWGPQYIKLYNDAYRTVIAAKHPFAMGRPGREVWAEIWDIIGPMLDGVLQNGDATWSDDQMLPLRRKGYTEECYFTFAYSPIRDETGGIGGVFSAVTETTERVLSERRLALLRTLADSTASDTVSPVEACRAAAEALGTDYEDLPFALLYLLSNDGTRLTLASASGLPPGSSASPEEILLGAEMTNGAPAWPLTSVIESGQATRVDDLATRFGALVQQPWPEPVETALALPIARPGQERPYGVFVAGVSPRRAFDDAYRSFLDLVAGRIATAVANARAYEEERERAEALAELDRAKTAFFSNVSHEFRTPLTLLLGPLEGLLGRTEGIPSELRPPLEVAHRNALRLLKLVNTLLEFSRIEAGRVEATYEPTNLATFTTELASSFRSAAERGGVSLVLDCPPLPEPVYVDREMWEKVVFNLISNALKHTFEGTIIVAMRAHGGHVELAVHDTGIGIPPEHLSRVFDRFHRVPNARSRTYEGTGIGLALVKELVRYHGGTIDVESDEGKGTTFVVRLPFGSSHLPHDRVRRSATEQPSPTRGARPYVEEALNWVRKRAVAPVPSENAAPSPVAPNAPPRILLADDNADMRDYVARLLEARGWSVEAVSDGRAALDVVLTRRPDLVLSDVMMPGLDGFALLRELRARPETHTIPVILLSARAGTEARVDGAEAGADDYIVKPFAAHELVARVGSHLALARERAEALQALERAREQADAARREAESANRVKSDFLAAMSHELRTPLNAIGGYVQLLELGIHGPITDAQRSALARIERSEKHLLSLINDILNFAKLEAGRVEYTVSDVSLAEAVTAAMPIIQTQLGAKGLTCDVRIRADAVVRADREKVEQILVNLLSNAIKFTDRGGHVTVDAPTRVDGSSPPGVVFLRVADTGIGVPEQKQSMIFEPFVQVARNPSRATEGTGLGLAISRDLARGMGGDLRVRSVEGQGAVFTLTLPASGAISP